MVELLVTVAAIAILAVFASRGPIICTTSAVMYDLSSFGPQGTSADDFFYNKEHRQNVEVTGRWVKNW